MICIIEHLEPRLSQWCMLEYRHISREVGKKNLWFTNVRRPSGMLKTLGRVCSKHAGELHLLNPCVLDPCARMPLTPKEARTFSHLIFGGILGNDPPGKRTQEVCRQFPGLPRRNLGKKQMSTDTAVLVAKRIYDGFPFSTLHFRDGVEIELSRGESVILPYRYLVDHGKPILPSGLIRFLKRKRSF